MLQYVFFIIALVLNPFCLHSAHHAPLMIKQDDHGISILVEKNDSCFHLPTIHTLIHKTKVTEDSLYIGHIPGRKIILSNEENGDLSHAPNCQWIHASQFMRKRDGTILSVKTSCCEYVPLDDDFARILTVYKFPIMQAFSTIAPQQVNTELTQLPQPQPPSYQTPTHQHVGLLYFSTDKKNNVHLLLTKVGKRQRYGILTEIYDPKKNSFNETFKTIQDKVHNRFADHPPKAKSAIESHITHLSSDTITPWSTFHTFESENVIFNILPRYIPRMIALNKKNAWVPLNNHYPLETKTKAFLKRYGEMIYTLAQHHHKGK